MFPQRGPCGEIYPFPEPSSTHHLIKNKISFFPQNPRYGSPPPCFPNGAPVERYAPSPEPMVYLFNYISRRPQLRNHPTIWRENIVVVVHGTQSGWKAYIQWGVAWFHKGIVYNTAVTTPVACKPSAGYLPPWLGKIRSLLARACLSNPLRSIPSTPVTAYHVTQVTNPRDPEVQTRGWIYGRQDGTDNLSRSVGNKLPIRTA